MDPLHFALNECIQIYAPLSEFFKWATGALTIATVTLFWALMKAQKDRLEALELTLVQVRRQREEIIGHDA